MNLRTFITPFFLQKLYKSQLCSYLLHSILQYFLLLFSSKSLSSASSTSVSKKSKLASAASNSLHQPQGVGSNKKERRRTQSINNAFASLRDCIPNVPCDTKLSKIKTLRLATSYIDYLMQLLNSENVGNNAISGFKADIHKRWKEKSEEQKRRELVRL